MARGVKKARIIIANGKWDRNGYADVKVDEGVYKTTTAEVACLNDILRDAHKKRMEVK